MTKYRIKFWFLGLLVLFVTACSRQSPPTVVSVASSECRLVQHSIGETQVCGQPEKVAALSPHILDSILALGVQPAAYAETVRLNLPRFDNPATQIPHLGNRITTQPVNLGDRQNPSLETLVQLKPDVIIGEHWLHQDEYHLLSKIAPTLLFDDTKGENQHWTNDITGIAQALDREAAAKKLLAAFPQQLATAREKLAPVVAAYPRVLVVSTNQLASQVSVAPDSTAGELMNAIGFEIVSPKLPTQPDTWAQISLEVLPTINTDLIFVIGWTEGLYNPEKELKQAWSQHPLLKTMETFQENRVFFVDYQLWGSNIRGPITDELILQQLPELLLPLVK
ncbi:periplasmic binding protein [Gloeocapsa sp. PCC 7428]|uniref:ABC transporter substrate-binding protein n=1 Tax=Gloeocapsa sp. PCC 7428 TaxID=1173026 RepID=UPI0002A6062A|nr:iron-siderophore ABC transporter substrate-binding protein [Gloeocapsa sp. PCC 7428]AFZ29289.1 periplasmic binding protein [Gloeocapsa sp. PCC 7428]